MSEFPLSNPTRSIRVGVILMNSITETLDVVPVDLLHGVSKTFIESMPDELVPAPLREHGLPLQFHWVAEHGSKEPRQLTSGLRITPTNSFTDCPPLDIVLVGAPHVDYVTTPTEQAFIQKAYRECSAFMTVCGGIQIAVEAGLVAGKTVTAPRFMLSQFRAATPDATWVEKRYVQDGKLWTSGALHNGLDMMAAFMKQTWPAKDGMPSVVEFALVLGSGLNRDINYKDEPLPAQMQAA